MKKNDPVLDVALLGLGALVGFTILKSLAQPTSRRRLAPAARPLALAAPSRDFAVRFSIHGSDFRFGGTDPDNVAPTERRTIYDARQEAARFVTAAQALEPRAVIVNLRTGEESTDF